MSAPVAAPADLEKDAPNQPAGGLSPELQKALARLTEISSLPEITTRIVEVVENPKSTAQDMHDIVKNDPALASKILKVVNSAFYGLPSQISSLDRAIVMIGLSAVKNLALAASLARLFRPGNITDRFSARDLWTHCIAVGVCARLLAEKGIGRGEEAFVAGLVHDMGLLVEFQLFPEKLKAVVEHCEGTGGDFLAAERDTIGADHQTFGAALAAKWKFPPGLRSAISHHHNPESLKPELRTLVTVVQVADAICCQNEIGFCLTAAKAEISDEMASNGMDPEACSAALEVSARSIKEIEQIFAD